MNWLILKRLENKLLFNLPLKSKKDNSSPSSLDYARDSSEATDFRFIIPRMRESSVQFPFNY